MTHAERSEVVKVGNFQCAQQRVEAAVREAQRLALNRRGLHMRAQLQHTEAIESAATNRADGIQHV